MTLLIPLAFLAALLAATQWGLPWWTASLPVSLGVSLLALSRSRRQTLLAISLISIALAILRADTRPATQSDLTRLVSAQEVTAVRGEVVDEPSPRDRAQLVRLRANAVRLADGDWQIVAGTVQVTARLSPPIHYGEFLEARGRVQPPEIGATPAHAAFLRRQGIDAIIAFPAVEYRGDRIGATLLDRLIAFRAALTGSLERLLPEPHASLAEGILLGRRATIPPALTDHLRLSGTSHITAVSGFNVSLVVGLIAAATGLKRARRAWHRLLGAAIASIALWIFVALVGGSGSVLRAAAMAQLALVGACTGRTGTAGGMLLWGSALLAAWSPAVLADVGWQLSFLGTAGLAWFAGPLEHRLGWIPGPARAGLAGTLAAQIFVLPILLSTFGSVSLVAPVANVLALPLVSWIMLGAFLAAACSFVFPPAAALFAALSWVPLSALLWIVDTTATLPWASIALPPLAPLGVMLYLAALVVLCTFVEARAQATSPDEEREIHAGSVVGSPPYASRAPLGRRITQAVFVALGALVCVGFVMVQPPGGPADGGALLLDAPAIEEGSLLLLQAPDGSRLLVDGGPVAGGAVSLLGGYVRPWDRTVDAVIATDPRESHITGLSRVLERYRVGLFVDAVDAYPSSGYRALRDSLQHRGVQRLRMRSDDTITFGRGGLTVTPLPTVADAASLSLRVQWGAFTALFPGDLTAAQLRALLTSDADVRATVMVLPERALRLPETLRLLRASDPELVVVQGAAAEPPDTDLPTAWHVTAHDGPLHLRVRPDGTYSR